MSRRTLYSGIRGLEAMSEDGGSPPLRPSGNAKRIRRPGGGRPKATQRQAGLEQAFEDVLDAHSASSPTAPEVVWTDLKPMQLAGELLRHGFEIGRNTAARLLERAGYRRRFLSKELITAHVDPYERDRQLRHSDALRRQARAGGNPELCGDTKNRELLGWLHRPGQCCSTSPSMTFATLPTRSWCRTGSTTTSRTRAS